ncbi:hypothetical protein MKW94_020121 [Papaver nudicaule]|uniref:Uncharacterized protein n=1 Tax=Papaver nudicaule TaxID=74823 RepID=A0AA41W217_PAPNU|nr:hypothetical protein [Papaver nudicaule]
MNSCYIFFGWRKASTCKRLIKRVQCRIKLLKNKRESMIRHSRQDIIQLLNNGQDQTAFALVGRLSMDQNIVGAYELLEHFCEFIMFNLPYIRHNRDCPNDINEAASSLLYASARFGDLPELLKLRKLFGERYGNRFAIAAVELLPGNLVNRQLIQKLSAESISDDAKFRLMKEVARENCLEMDSLQNDVRKVHESYSANDDFHWDLKDMESQCIGLQVMRQVQTREDTKFDALLLSDSKELLVIGSKVEKIPGKLGAMDDVDAVYLDKNTSERNSGICSTPSKVSNSYVSHKIEEAVTGVSTPEGTFQISDRNIVYLDDDGEQVEPSTQVDGNFKERKLFVPLEKESSEQDKVVSSDVKTSSRNPTKRRKSSRKRLKRRRYLCMENQMSQSPISVCSSIMDIEYAFYYNDLRHNGRNNQKSSMLVEDRGSLSFNSKENMKFFSSQQWCRELRSPEELGFEEMDENFESHKWKYQRRAKSSCGFNCVECSLDNPCYFVTSDCKDDWKSIKLMNRATVSHEQVRGKLAPVVQENYASSRESCTRETSPWKNKNVPPPYLRAMTLPPPQ